MRAHSKIATTLGALMTISLVGLHPHFSLAADVESIQIVNFGLYKTTFEKWEAAPGTSDGKIELISDRQLIELTDKIPCTPGTELGVQYVVNGRHLGKPVGVLVKVIHSGKGRILSTDQWLRTRPVGSNSFEGWKFDAPSQRAPKNMTIQLYHDGRKMAEKSFTLYSPQQEKSRGTIPDFDG